MKSFMMALLLWGVSQAEAAEYLVKYRNNQGLQAIQDRAAMKSSGMMIMDAHDRGSYMVVDFDETAEANTVPELMADPNIEWIHENGLVHAFETSMSPVTLKEQWAMTAAQATKAWERSGNRGSRNVIVAVIDTGVDSKHPALAQNMIPGFDFHANDNDPMDETSRSNQGHGTHCSGVIGATGLIQDGTIGLSPEVSIMPLRFLGPNGSGDFNNAIKAIDYAVENGAQVISASWGARMKAASLTGLIEAVKRATDKGVIFVVAAANSNQDNDRTEYYPTNVNTLNTISVAASNSRDGKASFSNYGKSMVHVAAPGENIISTIPGGGYVAMSGTSMATPMVAGLVAFLKAQDPNLTGAQIRSLIQATGKKVNIETACNCRIDAFEAVDHLLSKKPLLVPMTARANVGETLQMSTMNTQGAVTYASKNPEILTVDANGLVTFVTGGAGRVTASDANGVVLESYDLMSVGKEAVSKECPFSSPKMCKFMCWISPKKPYCQK